MQLMWLRFLIIFLSFGAVCFAKAIHYTVEFKGLQEDPQALKMVKSASSLIAMKKEHPPSSINALRYRAQADIPKLIQALHAYGYYEAKITIQVQEVRSSVKALVLIDAGPRYRLQSFDILLYCQIPDQPSSSQECCQIDLQEIGIVLNEPVLAQNILDGELKTLERLAQCGFPLASIEKREMLVDAQAKSLRVHLFVKTEEKASFGPVTIVGLEKVKPLYIAHKRAWQEAEVYDSRLVEKTQTDLMNSGLFSSVLITHDSALSSTGQIPMKIEVMETKHKTLNLGVSYQTVFGPGITFGWENRNVAGMGRKLSFQGDITRISQTGLATYLHPEFLRLDQDLICQAQAAHESLFAYSMRSYNMMQRIDRKFGTCYRAALGMRGERLYVTASVHNGNYWLLEFPLYFRWSTANDLLDPTRGMTLEFTTTPTLNIPHLSQSYLTQEFSECTYHPLTKDKRIVLAQQLRLGLLWSSSFNAVPLSKRYLGGSEQELRGYRYRTVSPLKSDKPEGGRSAIYFLLETRFRISRTIGLVPFFDIGNVYKSPVFSTHGKWHKSVGLGLRYFTFMGPFRLDLAFPLDRRKGIDPVYKVLASIGQTF